MHSAVGYSAVSTYRQCPYRYKLQYIEGLKIWKETKADDALIIGSAFHLGMEKGLKAALQWYYDQFPVLTDEQVTEALKLERAIRTVRPMLDPRARHETFVRDGEFCGTIDYLEPVSKGVWDMIDFKYCALKNIPRYRDSAQLHVYKSHFEYVTGQQIRRMAFLCVPKVGIKRAEGEDLWRYRERIRHDQEALRPELVQVEYDPAKVEEFDATVAEIKAETSWPKQRGPLCRWCDYQEFCEKGRDYMLLPSVDRREIGKASKRKIWIYGPSFSGKTTMLDEAPNPLNLNTDGNINFVTMPVIPIRDEVTVEGRITKRKFAWEIFKDAISELEKKQNEFKTIIIDLVEDTREMCRLYKYDELGITHESDAGYGKGWDIIKTEYLSVMRRFFNLDYENLVIVSHEIDSEIKKKSGQTITKVAPNVQEAIANKLAGMCDIVARVVVEDDGSRTLNFKSSEYIFGGGRLKDVKTTKIPLSWDALCEVYDASMTKSTGKASKNDEKQPEKEEAPKRMRKRREPEAVEVEPIVETMTAELAEGVQEDAGEPPMEPVKRVRKRREIEEPNVFAGGEIVEAEPVKRVRKRRVHDDV